MRQVVLAAVDYQEAAYEKMKRETVVTVLEMVSAVRTKLADVRGIIDGEALQVGDRNMIDQSIGTMVDEVVVLTRTLTDILEDATRSE